MSPFQQALLAIEIAVDCLREHDTESSRDALAQIGSMGFDTRTAEERKQPARKNAEQPKPFTKRKNVQRGLF